MVCEVYPCAVICLRFVSEIGMPFVATILGNAVGLLVAVWVLPQFLPGSIAWTGDFWQLLLAGGIIGLINAVLRPIFKFLSLPLILLTAGVFGFLINIGMLWLADYFIPQLSINGFVPLALTTAILAVVHVIL